MRSVPSLARALLRCRLSRNIAFLFRMRDEGVKFQAIDIPEANTLALGVFDAMAQHEREIISARTKAALAARKARGLPLGTLVLEKDAVFCADHSACVWPQKPGHYYAVRAKVGAFAIRP